jgi:CRISPR-associated protein Csd2
MISNERVREICETILDGSYVPSEPLKARHIIVGLVEVINGNPNGDPATGGENLPRTDIVDGHGIISSVCIKRKIRDTVKLRHEGDVGYELYCERGSNVGKLQDEIHAQVREVFDDVCKARGITKAKELNDKWQEKHRDILVTVVNESFFDVRAFGCVLTRLVQVGSGKKNKVPVPVKGPVQVCDAKSFDVVAIDQRMLAPSFGNKDDLDRNFGSKAVVPYGLYMFHVDVSPFVARNTHMTEADLVAVLDGLKWAFELDQSSSRGEQNLIRLWDFEHGGEDQAFGAQPQRELIGAVRVEKKCEGIPSSLLDYDISFDDSVVSDDVKVTRLV